MTGIEMPIGGLPMVASNPRSSIRRAFAVGLAVCAAGSLASAQTDSGMRVATLGDFNTDGKDDVLLRHADGRWHLAPMDGPDSIARLSGRAYIADDPELHLAAAGDFDGDGYRDAVLLRDAAGEWRHYWMFNRWGEQEPCRLDRLPTEPAWQVKGVGDLDNDGDEDLLLRHHDGKWRFVAMQCGSAHGKDIEDASGAAEISDDRQHRFAALADFDGDGFRDDVLLRHEDGAWLYYEMQGRLANVQAATAPRDLAWRLAGVGDLNHDGRDDLLLRHKDGRWLLVPMDGPMAIPTEAGIAHIDQDRVRVFAAIGDFDGDGFADDVLLRDRGDGGWHYYAMDGADVETRGLASIPSDMAWNIAGTPRGPGKVDIPDANLRAVLARALGAFEDADGDGRLSAGETIHTITARQMRTISNLIVPAAGISDLTGLEHATNLSYLYLDANEVEDLQPLGWLLELSFLYVRSNPVRDLAPLRGLPSLTELVLQGAGLADVAPLATLANLTQLQLDSNAITDIAPLAALTKLRELVLTHNAVHDLTPLASLAQLQFLHAGGNAVSDLRPLAGLHKLVYVDLNSNAVSDLAPLAGLANLTDLDLAHNGIVELSPLANLQELTYLYLDGNRITDLSALAMLDLTYLSLSGNGLTDIGPLATTAFGGSFPLLDLSSNNIADISALEGKFLWTLDLAANDIADLGPIARLPDLRELTIENNPATDLSPLARLNELHTLSVGGETLEDLTPLSALGGLRQLSISDSPIADLARVAGMLASDLITLELAGTGTTDLAALAGPRFGYLNNLALRGNGMAQLPPLGALTRLESLDIEDNDVADLTPLASLPQLLTLSLGSNPVADLSPLESVTALKSLAASNTQIADIASLGTLRSLRELRLDDARVVDIAALGSLRGGGGGDYRLSLARNEIADIAPLTMIDNIAKGDVVRLEGNPLDAQAKSVHIPALQSRGAAVFAGGGVDIPDAALRARLHRRFGKSGGAQVTAAEMMSLTSFGAKAEPFWWRWDVAYAPIRSLAGIEAAANLERLHLDGQRLTSIAPLAGLADLADVRLRNNLIADIGPLVQNEGLGHGDSVQLRGNPLSAESIETHIPALEARGVVVHR